MDSIGYDEGFDEGYKTGQDDAKVKLSGEVEKLQDKLDVLHDKIRDLWNLV